MKTLFQTYRFAIVLILLFPFSSCSSDDDSTPEPTTEELLANQWFLKTLEDLTVTPSTIEVADACEQNSYYNFLPSGDLLVEEFSFDVDDNCVSNIGVLVLSYSLNADETQIIALDGTESTILTLESVTETELIISLPSQRVTFERQSDN